MGGVDVNQETLNRAFSWLISHGCSQIDEDYQPDISKFGPYADAITCPEEYVYLLFDGQLAYKGFRAEFVDRGKDREACLRPRIFVLNKARFPYQAVVTPRKGTIREDLAAWAEGYKGQGTPWLWVCGGNDSYARTEALADVATKVAHMMDLHRAPEGHILYVRAHDLCEQVNTSDFYGEHSKWATLQEFMKCDLLFIDGIGEERAGSKELDTLSQLINVRWAEARPTVIASAEGCLKWVSAYNLADRRKAREMGQKVITAMCGYRPDISREQARKEIVKTHIDLSGKPAAADKPTADKPATKIYTGSIF